MRLGSVNTTRRLHEFYSSYFRRQSDIIQPEYKLANKILQFFGLRQKYSIIFLMYLCTLVIEAATISAKFHQHQRITQNITNTRAFEQVIFVRVNLCD